MDNNTLVAILKATLSGNNVERNAAEVELNKIRGDMPTFCALMSTVLRNESLESAVRQQAGLQLKITLNSNTENELELKTEIWFKHTPVEVRRQIKDNLLNTLNSKDKSARHVCTLCIAKIAGIEMPMKEWGDLFSILCGGISNGEEGTKLAGLETLGFVCEEIPDGIISQKETNIILEKVVMHMNLSFPAPIIEASITALFNMLTFIVSNFSIQNERNEIMTALCNVALKGPTVNSRKLAYECLVQIISFYYHHMEAYMQSLFSMTLNAIQNEDSIVALQAIEFWSTLSEEEASRIEREAEFVEAEEDMPDDEKNNGYVDAAKGFLIPILLTNMTKQEEDSDETTWDISTASAVCLGLVALVIADDVIPLVLPFVNENVGNADWRKRDAAILAFGNILDGPSEEKILNIVLNALPHFLKVLKEDPSNAVKDSAAYTAAVVFENYMHVIPKGHWAGIVKDLVDRLNDPPSIARKVCDCLHYIAATVPQLVETDEEIERETNVLSPFFVFVIQNLIDCSDRGDSSEFSLRNHCYEAMNGWIANAANDQMVFLKSLLERSIHTLNVSLQTPLSSEDVKVRQHQLQICLCATFETFTRRLESEICSKLDEMMSLLIKVLDNSPHGIEEAFLAIGAISDISENDFNKYMPALQIHIHRGLISVDIFSLCVIVIGVVGDAARSIMEKIAPYSDSIMTDLLNLLTNRLTNKYYKPPIIACFNDLAMALKDDFAKYTPVILPLLVESSKIKASEEEDDEDLLEHFNELHGSILEAYTGLVHGLETSGLTILMPYMEEIFNFLLDLRKSPHINDEVTKNAVLLISDLTEAYGDHIKSALVYDFIKDLVIMCLNSEDEKMQDAGSLACEKLSVYGIEIELEEEDDEA